MGLRNAIIALLLLIASALGAEAQFTNSCGGGPGFCNSGTGQLGGGGGFNGGGLNGGIVPPYLNWNFATGSLAPTGTGAGAAGVTPNNTQSTAVSTCYVNGILTTFAANTVRLCDNPSTGVQKSVILTEGAAQNLAIQSGALANASWSQSATASGTISITGSSGTAPDGTNSATLISINRSATTDRAVDFMLFTGSAAAYTGSFFIEAATAGVIGNQVTGAYLFNGSTNTGNTANLTSGWARSSYERTLTTSAGVGVGYVENTGTGTGAVGILGWGAQAEVGNFATSYIPTTTVAVTRNTDKISATFPLPSFANGFDIIYNGITAPGVNGANQVFWSISDGTDNNEMQCYRSNISRAIVCSVAVSGVGTVSITVGIVADSTQFTVSFACTAAGSCTGSLNSGTPVTGSGTLPTGLNVVYFGAQPVTGQECFCYTSQLRIWNQYLTTSANDKGARVHVG